MNELICAVCGETDIKKLTMFDYGVCLCHRCLEISAHSFIHDNAERKLKETEKKEKKKESVDVEGMSKQEYESMKELKDEIAKKMAKSFEEIGKVIFVERDCQPESINDLKKALDKVKADLRTYKEMYRNRLGKFTNLMNEHKKLTKDYNKVIKAQDSLTTNLINVQLDANRYRRECEEFRTKLKVCNTWMLVASAASLLVGVALGYGLR